MNSLSILVCECDSLFFSGPCLWWSSRKLDVLHHFQVCLSWSGQLAFWTTPNDYPYFSKRRLWWLFYLSLQLLVLVILSKEIPQFPLLDEILNLLLQIKTLICIMPMVSMEATILVSIALVGVSLHFLRPLQERIVLDLHENLLERRIQWCVLLISCWRACLFVNSVFLIFHPSLLWMRSLLRVASEVCLRSLNSLSFLGYDRVFCIHKVLGWMDEFSHRLRLFLIKLVDK